MKYFPVAGKAIVLLFTAVLLAACSSSPEKEEQMPTEDEMAKARAEQEATRTAQAQARQRALHDTAMQYGTVFYFDFDSYALKPEAVAALDAHIAYFLENNEPIRLEGHTDERGTREYNMALGERRANAVRDYMVVNGIPSYRIETVSYGEERPVAPGSGETNWSQNRRVELK